MASITVATCFSIERRLAAGERISLLPGDRLTLGALAQRGLALVLK
jgi:hypothetical protein